MMYVWVAVGSALGGMARYGVTRLLLADSGSFPWATFAVNVGGCFLMGFVGTMAVSNGRIAVPEGLRVFVMVGLCGGFTTFSSFSLETFALARSGDWFKAAANVTLSVGLCLLALALGHWFAEHALVNPPHGEAVIGSRLS
jgi:CrcB protein